MKVLIDLECRLMNSTWSNDAPQRLYRGQASLPQGRAFQADRSEKPAPRIQLSISNTQKSRL